MRFEHWFYTLPLRIRSIVRRRQVDRDLDDETLYHLEVQVEERVAAGMDRDEARRVVLRGFGEVVRAKEQCRDARGLNAIDSVGQDLRSSCRCRPQFTARKRADDRQRVRGVSVCVRQNGAPPARHRRVRRGNAATVRTFDQGTARYRLQLFVQGQNLANAVNYLGYSGTLTSRFFGRPTGVRDMRKIDIGLGLSF